MAGPVTRPQRQCRVMVLLGTRPEAIKLAPVILLLREHPSFETCICVTGQHREMLDPVLRWFDIKPHHDFDIMGKGSGLAYLTSSVLTRTDEVLSRFHPDRLLLQGDTTTAFAGGLAAFYRNVPVGHVEAGLRSGRMDAPWPEEANRRLLDALADLHFAPTDLARRNLLGEGIPERSIHVTGNTGVDALLAVDALLNAKPDLRTRLEQALSYLDPARRLVLVTGHRRESFGAAFQRICEAVKRVAGLGGLEVVYPVHLNPEVRTPVHALLGGLPNVHLVEPLDYPQFVCLMKRAALILTDSGGVQEEAPTLGRPVLIMREVTERIEAVEGGFAEIVGTDPDRIVEAARRLLREAAAAPLRDNPFGDGQASRRIVRILEEDWAQRG